MPKKYFFILSTLLFQNFAHAQFYTGPIAAAMGGSGRASNNAGESALLNPATLSQLKNYYGSLGMDWGEHPVAGASNEFAAMLADGSPDKAFPGDFSYVQKRVTTSSGYSTNLQDFQLGVADAPNDSVSFGLSIHRETYLDNTGHSYAQNNVNFGTLFTPIKELAFAFVAYDMLGGDSAVPQEFQTIPTWAVGATYKFASLFDCSLDVVRPDKFNEGHRLNTELGIETYFRNDFALRAGWQWHEVGFEEKLFSLGLGYKGPRLSVDYTFQKDTLIDTGVRQFVDLWLHF